MTGRRYNRKGKGAPAVEALSSSVASLLLVDNLSQFLVGKVLTG